MLIPNYKKTKLITTLLLFAIIIILSSCSISIFQKSSDGISSDSYTYQPPTKNWIEIPKDKSDIALMNKKTGSIITISSVCKKYFNTSLDNLSKNIFSSVNNIKIIKSNELLLFKRKTLRKHITGSLDGINISILSYTLIKNRCIYDFILIHPELKIAEDVLNDMNIFLETVKIN